MAVRCPKLRPPRCRRGTIRHTQRYKHRGVSCLRYYCKRHSCPVVSTPKCKRGYSAQKETYTWQGIPCQRSRCVRISCPSSSSLRCSRGQQRELERYLYKGITCTRYRCRSVSCPAASPVRCAPGLTSQRVTYTYRGVSCTRYQCQRVRCPRTDRPRCSRGMIAQTQYYKYKGVRCVRYRCTKPLRIAGGFRLAPVKRRTTIFNRLPAGRKVGSKGCAPLGKQPRCRRNQVAVKYPNQPRKSKKKVCQRWRCMPFVCPVRAVRKICTKGLGFRTRILRNGKYCLAYECSNKKRSRKGRKGRKSSKSKPNNRRGLILRPARPQGGTLFGR